MAKEQDGEQVRAEVSPGEKEGGRRPAVAWPCGWTTAPKYLSDHFQNQLKHWGINPSFAFIE